MENPKQEFSSTIASATMIPVQNWLASGQNIHYRENGEDLKYAPGAGRR